MEYSGRNTEAALVDANRLLARFPFLVRQVAKARYSVLYGGARGEAFIQGRSVGDYSDPTGKRALKLVRLCRLGRRLRMTRHFIDKEFRSLEQRELLLGVWRFGRHGWGLVARAVERPEPEVRLEWTGLVVKLAEDLGVENELEEQGATDAEGGIVMPGLSEGDVALPLRVAGEAAPWGEDQAGGPGSGDRL